jgi:DNA polymerase
MTYHIDFETYSDLDIKVVGGFRYAEDPSTEALILAFSDGTHPPIVVDLTLPGHLAKLTPLFNAIERGELICAHNVSFERNIWTKRCRFPVTPKPSQWDCTAVRARLLALPGSLSGAASALGLSVNKDPKGLELINIFSKPGKAGRIFPKDKPELFQEFMNYCAMDVIVETELDRVLPKLPEVEKRAVMLDYDINERGMPVNMSNVTKAMDYVEEYSKTVLKRAVEIAGCKPTQIAKTMEFLKSRGFDVPNLQAGTVEALIKKPGIPDDIQELLDSRIELSRAGTKKLTAIKNTVSEDGRIRGGFLFSAASTRRWSSTGVQMHNLQKPEKGVDPPTVMSLISSDNIEDLSLIFPRPLTAIAQSIRGFFESEQHFLVADYSSVEPRGLAWSAEEDWLLQAYHRKEDAYKIMAGKVFNIPANQVDKDKRFIGKQLVLGCGYGMGPPRFIESCAKWGVRISDELSETSVSGFRASVPAIIQFWADVEATAIKATKYWKTLKLGRFTYRPVTLANGYPILFIDMPSGSIAYPNPTVGEYDWYGKIKERFEFWTPLGSSFVKTDTFGGSLVENIIQAQTRDILRDGMVAANDAGFYVVGHCHDEAIAEGADSKSDLAEFERLLCTSSPWADNFPIATEGYISKQYRK